MITYFQKLTPRTKTILAAILTTFVIYGFVALDMLTGYSTGLLIPALSIVIYFVVLFLLIRLVCHKDSSYMSKLITGFTFHLVLSLMFGIFSGIGGYIFATAISRDVLQNNPIPLEITDVTSPFFPLLYSLVIFVFNAGSTFLVGIVPVLIVAGVSTMFSPKNKKKLNNSN